MDYKLHQQIVEKLGLQVTLYLVPYSIRWVQSRGGLKVSSRCTILIKIGKFEDVVSCDILEMDVCHILLGRPWEFNNQAIHKGMENTYEVKKGKQHFTLLPSKPKQGRMQLNHAMQLVTIVSFSHEFLNDLNASDVCKFLMMKHSSFHEREEVESLPDQVVKLFELFSEVV